MGPDPNTLCRAWTIDAPSYSFDHPLLRQCKDVARPTIFQRAIQSVSPVPALNTMIAVGVPCDPRQPKFKSRDQCGLSTLFETLASEKMVLGADFRMTPMDINFGSDFLGPAQKKSCDILYIGFIAGLNHPERLGNEDEACFATSEFDYGLDSWRKAVADLRPKVLISDEATENDIRASAIAPKGYLLHSSTQKRLRSDYLTVQRYTQTIFLDPPYATARRLVFGG